MICPNCSTTNGDGAGFCNSCGTPLQENMSCSSCGAKLDAQSKFCVQCGAAVAEEKEKGKKGANSGVLPHKKKKSKLPLIIGVVAVLIIAFIALMSGGDESKYDPYIAAVKGGYLGSFYNVTVGEVFEKQLFGEVTWNAGETDDGRIIVEASSSIKADHMEELMDMEELSIKIQFTCHNENNFEITAVGLKGIEGINPDGMTLEDTRMYIYGIYAKYYLTPDAPVTEPETSIAFWEQDLRENMLIGVAKKP